MTRPISRTAEKKATRDTGLRTAEAARPTQEDQPQSPSEVQGNARGYVRSRCGAMKSVESTALRIAPSDETVLILGETGVGKDMIARLIHQHSSRKDQAFVHLNCAALPETLLESELFGHMKGSYTGAVDSRPGQFEMASGGTLFLDEIGELPPRLQAKLLHVLQERKIYRIGGRQSVDIDVRVIAATNRDLRQAIRTGGFRRDLFYRLNVVALRVPPLRERAEDLEDLAHHFFRFYAGLYNRPDLTVPDESFLRRLRTLPWEGNIRELENVVKRVILLGGADDMESDIPAADAGPPGHPEARGVEEKEAGESESLKETARRAFEEAERRLILRTLARTLWNRKQAARELGVSYRALLYKIKDYTLRPETILEDDEKASSWH